MSKRETSALHLACAVDLASWFRKERVKGAIIGGLAVALVGKPRPTLDVDAVAIVPEKRWREFLSGGKQFGFCPRIADALKFAKTARIFLLRHKTSDIDVDLALGALPFEKELLNRAKPLRVPGGRFRVASPEDLIIMKAIANRPHDWADIEGIADAHPRLNVRRIRKWVADFAHSLEDPQITTNLERFLATLKKRRGN